MGILAKNQYIKVEKLRKKDYVLLFFCKLIEYIGTNTTVSLQLT